MNSNKLRNYELGLRELLFSSLSSDSCHWVLFIFPVIFLVIFLVLIFARVSFAFFKWVSFAFLQQGAPRAHAMCKGLWFREFNACKQSGFLLTADCTLRKLGFLRQTSIKLISEHSCFTSMTEPVLLKELEILWYIFHDSRLRLRLHVWSLLTSICNAWVDPGVVIV